MALTGPGQNRFMNTRIAGHGSGRTSLNRRGFLRTGGVLSVLTALAAYGPRPEARLAPPTPISPGSGALPATGRSSEVAPASAALPHLLRRLTFGPTSAIREEAERLGPAAWLDSQLAPDLSAGDEVTTRLAALTTLTMTPAERAALEPKTQSAQELVAATLIQQRYSRRQVSEMLVDFWSTHFSIHLAGQPEIFLKTDDDQLAIRPNAVGRFGDLLRASAHSPAMLTYLNQAESTRVAPNENYARELLELHTVGVDGGYTQGDVEALARVLTGWSIVAPRRRAGVGEPGRFLFRTDDHDDAAAQVMTLAIPAGAGQQGGEDVLSFLAAHPATARFIVTKLARRFVADTPAPSLIDALAAVFTTTAGDTGAVLRALVSSSDFAEAAWQKLKRPLEFVVSALRVTEAQTAQLKPIVAVLRGLGHVPFGWEAPNGFPDVAPYWLTTSGLLGRWNFALDLVAGHVKDTHVDLAALTRDTGSPEDVVDVLALRFIGEPLPTAARAILVDVARGDALERRLPLVAGLILASPFFQRR